MKMNFNRLTLFFVLFIGFLQFAVCQICKSINQTDTCATLTCQTTCQKRNCTKPVKLPTPVPNPDDLHLKPSKIAAYTVGPIIGLMCLITIVVVTVKCIRSRRSRLNRENSSKSMSERSAVFRNKYHTNPTGPPPIPDPDDPSENMYEPIYTYYEISDLQGRENSVNVTTRSEEHDGYEVPNNLNKPNLPLPQAPRSFPTTNN